MSVTDMYVINLNRKRVLLLSGIFFVMLGTTLWLGLRIGSMRSNNFVYQDKLSLIAEEMGIGDKELKNLNLSEINAPLKSLLSETLSTTKLENTKVPPIQNLAKYKKSEIPEIHIRERDPLEKKREQVSKRNKGKYFSIQIAAFKKKKQAIVLLKKMKADGFSDIRIDRGIRYYYVRMGNARNKEILALENQRVKQALGLDTIIIQADG